MIDFDFLATTRIRFGRGALSKLPEEVERLNAKNVLLVYGSDRIKQNGLFGKVAETLQNIGVAFYELGGIRENPYKSRVIEGVSICREHSVDLIVSIGGGSPADTAKSIAVGYFYDGDPFDFNLHTAVAKKALPIGVILTIASAGSETSNSCVIQDDETKVKSGFNNDIIRPAFAIEDPEYTFTVSPWSTAVGVADTMMHSIERYFNLSYPYQVADDFALALIKKTMEAGKAALKDPNDYDARSALMLFSTISHNGITNLGKTGGFSIHPIEHGLSGYKPDIIHGAGVALIYPAWAEHVMHYDVKKFADFTKYIFNVCGENDEDTAIIGIRRMKEYFISLGLPSSLKDVGLSKSDIPAIADLVTGKGTRVIGRYPKSLDREEVIEILERLA